MAAQLEREEFSYAALVNRWRRERSTRQLTRMDDRFYEAFDQHLRALHEEHQREQANDPAGPKALILFDEISRLQRVRDDLYEIRETKIAIAATTATRESAVVDRSNMTPEEIALFEALVGRLRESRAKLLKRRTEAAAAAPQRGGPPAPPDALAQTPRPVAAAQPASTLPASAPAPEAPLALEAAPVAARAVPAAEELRPAEEPRRPESSRVLVRMRQNVEPFVAPDLRHYRLAAEDVAALPRDVAHVLVQRGLASVLGA